MTTLADALLRVSQEMKAYREDALSLEVYSHRGVWPWQHYLSLKVVFRP